MKHIAKNSAAIFQIQRQFLFAEVVFPSQNPSGIKRDTLEDPGMYIYIYTHAESLQIRTKIKLQINSQQLEPTTRHTWLRRLRSERLARRFIRSRTYLLEGIPMRSPFLFLNIPVNEIKS